MRMLEHILGLLAPHVCVVCRDESSSLCDTCSGLFAYPDRCYVCKKPSASSLTCQKCRQKHPLSAVYIFAAYKSDIKELVGKAKYSGAPEIARRMGELLALKLPYFESGDTIVTHIPTTPSRIRERGFDQSQRMSSAIAISKGLLHAGLLYRKKNTHQVGSTRKQRIEHMMDAFGVKNGNLLHGRTVILVDDVFTTGSSIESAARLLKNAGARRVIGAVFARAE